LGVVVMNGASRWLEAMAAPATAINKHPLAMDAGFNFMGCSWLGGADDCIANTYPAA
jgi:hypothetical protein